MASEPTIPKLAKYDVRNGVVRRRWLSTWYDEKGKRHSKDFGFETDTTERQALRRWEAWKLKWKSRQFVQTPAQDDPTEFTVTRLAARFLRHAARTFVKDGKRTSHVENIRYAMRTLRDAYGERIADSIEAPDVAELRDGSLIWRAVDGDKKARALKTVNTRLRIVKDAFAWAREKRLVSPATLADILSVRRLRKGRSAARNTKRIKSVDAATVDVTMNRAPQVVKDMVELQELTGMRPGEVCDMRGIDVEAGGDVWLYRPTGHKLEHLEGDASEKIVCLGPKAQAIVKKYLKADTTAHLFSPADAHGQRLEARRALRKTKLYPSHAAKRRDNPTGRLGRRYTEGAYRKAVHYACKLAGVSPWNPNQLRHAAATRLQKKYGRDGSRVVLGHKHESTTEIYLDPDVQKAMQIAREVG